MPSVDWMLRGPKLGACSCCYGCPCEFNARLARVSCDGVEVRA